MGITAAPVEGNRIRPIDAARGSAMLFVFLSHFVEVYFKRHSIPVTLAYDFTMIASPAFMAISGVMLGVLFSTRRDNYAATKSSFIRRGIFLLTGGRILIWIAHIPISGGWYEALRWGFMTDAIGFSIILGPMLMEKLSGYQRAVLGTLIYGISWFAIVFWTPLGIPMRIVKETFFGPFISSASVYIDVFPLLPWFGLYLIATPIGEFIGGAFSRREQEKAGRAVLLIGLTGFSGAACLVIVRHLLHREFGESLSGVVNMVLSPFQKLPPSPVYFLFYAGSAFLMLYCLMRFQRAWIVRHYSAVVEVIGRNSLFVFIVQYFVYFAFFTVVDFPLPMLWPVYFFISAAVIWGLAFLWDKGKMNRYLTIPRMRFANVNAPNN